MLKANVLLETMQANMVILIYRTLQGRDGIEKRCT